MSVKPKRALIGAAALIGLLLTAACGGGGDDDSGEKRELREIKVGIPTTQPTVGQMAYTSLPEALGYAEEEGIIWKPVLLAGSGPVMQAIQTGAVDVGLGGTESVAAAIQSGLTAKVAYMAITGNVQIPYVPEDSDIQTFKDFEGKTVGVLDLGAALVNVIKGSVQAAGGDPDKVTFVKVGAGADALVALQRNRVHVLGVPDNFSAEVAALGAKLRPILDDRFRALGATQGIVFPQKMLDEDPDLAAAIARAVAKSTLFGTVNPEAAVKLHWQRYPDSKPSGDEAKALTVQTAIAKARLDAMQPIGGLWGNTTAEQLQARLQTAYDAGDAQPDKVNKDTIWTDALLQKINNFDKAAVEADAKAGGPR